MENQVIAKDPVSVIVKELVVNNTMADKTFMSLSPGECLKVYPELLNNAHRLYKDSITLADTESYGPATSLLIHSMEETMKTFVLFLDGNGFEFRKHTRGINNLFENHTLRYPLAMALSIISIFGRDLKNMLVKNPNKLLQFAFNIENGIKLLANYLISYAIIIGKEINWFSNVEIYRQQGFYVDFEDQLKTPLNASKEDFEQVKIRIDHLNEFVLGFIESFQIKDENHQKELDRIRVFFKTKDKENKNIYEHLSYQIDKFRDRKVDQYASISESFNNLIADMLIIQNTNN